MSTTILPGDLGDPRVLRLLEEHLSDMYATSPAESVHALDPGELAGELVSFWIITDGDDVFGCAALKQLDSEHGELKSMRTDTATRGQGLGSKLLEHVLDEARARGYRRLSLETGPQPYFAAARSLYEKYGFEPCGPFGDYRPDPHSVFMTLELP